jgi:hypothetical protein
VRCWEGGAEFESRAISLTSHVTCVACLHDAVLVVATRDGRVTAYDSGSLKEVGELSRVDESCAVVTAVADGPATLVAGCSDGALRVWEVPAHHFQAPGQLLPPCRVLRGSHGAVDVCQLVAAGAAHARCFSGAVDGSVSGWQHNSALGGEVRMACPGQAACSALCLDAAAALLFGASADGSLRCWRSVDGSLFALQPRAHAGRIEALVLRAAPPSALYSGSLDGTVRAWAMSAAPSEPSNRVRLPRALGRAPLNGPAAQGCQDGLTAAVSAMLPSAALRQSLRDDVAELEVAASAGAEALRDSLWAAAAEAEAWGSAAVAAAKAAAEKQQRAPDPGPALTAEPDGYGSYAHIREDEPPPIRAQWPPPARPDEGPPPVLGESIVQTLSAAASSAAEFLSPGSPSRAAPTALLRSLTTSDDLSDPRALLGSPSTSSNTLLSL